MSLDPQEFVRQQLARMQPKYGYATVRAEDPGIAVEVWQAMLRALLTNRLFPMGSEMVRPIAPKVQSVQTLDGYRRETVTFETRPGLTAFGYFLVPEGITGQRPAVLCLPGHGRGVDSIVGITEDGRQRGLREPDEYAADFALQCVAQGCVVFALEQISFGHRRDAKAATTGNPNASSCVRDSMAALALGESMIGWRVWDALRAVDFLLSRPEVAADKIGVMGISGGGTIALFTAALDERIAACVVSGYLNTWTDSILSVDHCVDNYAPGMRNVCEMPDVAGLIAPRLLFAESGKDDPIFPLHGFEKAVAVVQHIYNDAGVPERFGFEVFDAGHIFHGVAAFAFLNRYFL